MPHILYYLPRITIFLAVIFTGSVVKAANFFPLTAAELITAINTANSNNQNDVIDLGAQTIIIASANNGVNGLPVILADSNHTLTIENGTIARSFVNNTPVFRFFETVSAAQLTLSHLRLTNGNVTGVNVGGAIYNAGRLTINNAILDSNSAEQGGGAINLANFPNMNVTITFSTFFENQSGNAAGNNGGAIRDISGANSVITVERSLFYNNEAYSGGAIYSNNRGNFNLRNSTLSHNQAFSSGGGLFIEVGATHVLSENNTIADNYIFLINPFGGGIYFAGAELTIRSTIVASNVAVTGPDIYQTGAGVITESNNLIGINNGAAAFVLGSPNANQSYVGDAISPINPLLNALAYQGGPTQTRSLQVGSLALDHGSASAQALPYDQRGPNFARTSGAGTDIGAFEVQGCGFDSDADSVCDTQDNCPQVYNPTQEDGDSDNVGSACDNCVAISNTDQLDSDADGIGNACDSFPEDNLNDADGDLIGADEDNCPFDVNVDQIDTDSDGIGDICDLCPAGDNDQDEDGDGIPDDCDFCPDDFDNFCFDHDPGLPIPVPIPFPPPPPPGAFLGDDVIGDGGFAGGPIGAAVDAGLDGGGPISIMSAPESDFAEDEAIVEIQPTRNYRSKNSDILGDSESEDFITPNQSVSPGCSMVRHKSQDNAAFMVVLLMMMLGMRYRPKKTA